MIIRHSAVLLVVFAFVIVRFSVLWMSPAGQDEEWYGIPGYTVAREGVPRVPYSRATEPESVMRGADKVLFAQPPLSFYAQAIFFLGLPATCGTARLASFIAACLSIVVTYAIGCSLVQSRRAALVGTSLYSVSRLFYFPAISARPDMLCGLLGLLAVYCLVRKQQTSHIGWLVAAGASVGLAGLTHPFAIVFAIQSAVWVCFMKASIALRMVNFLILSAAIIIAFSLWLPLIFWHYELFQMQFIGNILRPAGPGLASRFVLPFESFADQIPQLFERAHPIQFCLLAVGLTAATIIAYRTGDANARICVTLSWSSIYLLIVCVGVHPIQGFWCYSAALSWLCVAYAIRNGVESLKLSGRSIRFSVALVGLLLLAAMIPGSGLRTPFVYLRNFSNPNYSSPLFIRDLLKELPQDATITVGPEYVLDAYTLGRDVILTSVDPFYFDSTRYPTDYYVFSRRNFPKTHVPGVPPMNYPCEYVRSYGIREDIFSNYAEVYRSIAEE